MTKPQQAVLNHLKAKLEGTGETVSNISAAYEKTARQLEQMGLIAVLGRYPTRNDLQVELLRIES